MGSCTSRFRKHRREGINEPAYGHQGDDALPQPVLPPAAEVQGDAADGHLGADALPLLELPPAAEIEADDEGVAADDASGVGVAGQHSRDQESNNSSQPRQEMEEPKPSTSRPQLEITISPQPAPSRVKTSSSEVRDQWKYMNFRGGIFIDYTMCNHLNV